MQLFTYDANGGINMLQVFETRFPPNKQATKNQNVMKTTKTGSNGFN